MSEEKIFFEDANIKVTSSRIVSGNQTFALANITSVEARRDVHKAKLWPSALAGLFGLGYLNDNAPLGWVMIVFAVFWVYQQMREPDQYHITLRTAGNESNAYTSTNATYVDTICQAINDAIVYRG